MIRKGVIVLVAFLMMVSMFAPFVAGTSTTGAATPHDARDVSLEETNQIDPAPVDQSLQDANGTVEVVVRAEEFEVPDVSTMSNEAAVEEMKTHAAESQQPILDYAESTDGVEVLNQFWLANAVVLELDTSKVDVEKLAAQDGVTSVHANFEVNVPEPVNGSASNATDTTYGLDQINATEVWSEYDTKGSGAKVAVLDTGVDAGHPDIDLYTENASNATYPGGWAEFDDEGNRVEGSTPHDTAEHGTHTSGTVVGGDASGEYVGVAPNADLMHGMVLPGGSGSFAQILAGMEWAVQEDADVISMSFGTEDYTSQFIEPVRNARDAGTAAVAAAGNCYEGCSGSPGNVYDSFAIGASNSDADIAGFSSGERVDTDQAWGSDAPADWPDEYVVPDVAAPGVAVKSAEPGGSYQQLSGTSMATPHVAGAMALMVAASGGTANVGEMETALEETAWKPAGESDEQDTRYGHGIIDVSAAADRVAIDTGVEGTVTDDATGAAVEGATVESAAGFQSPTDANGGYSLGLAPGNHTVTADAFGYASETATVTVPANGTVERNFSLAPEFDATVVDDQPDQLLSGDSVVTELRLAHADEITVEQVGNFSAADATLTVGGTEYDFGETISLDDYYGTLTVEVETAEGSSGTLELEYAVSGLNESAELATGPTKVFAEGDQIGVVATPGDSHAAAFADMITAQRVTYQTTVITPREAIENVEEYDALVVHSLGNDREGFDAARELLDVATDHQVGLVVMDQQGNGANAISQLSKARGYPRATNYPSHFLIGSPSYYADIKNGSHSLWEDVEFDNITTAPPDFIRSDVLEWTTVHWAGFDGTTRALAGQYLLSAGRSIGTDAPRGVVLMGSHGYTSTVGEGDYTENANRAVGNAVGWAMEADESSVFATSGPADRVDPGGTIEATFDVENLTKVRTELADSSTISADDLTLRHGSEATAFGEWRTYDPARDDDAFSVAVATEDGVTGTVELEHTFVVERNGETHTFNVTTQRTSVYEPPIEVPKDADSIQAAVDMAVPNAEIVVSEGTYTEQVVVPFDRPSYNVTIRGEDGATPTVKAPDDLGENEGVIEIQSRYVTVENLDIQGPDGPDRTYGVLSGVHGLSTPTHYTTVRDVSVDDSHWGIGIGGQNGGSPARHATVSNVRVTNASTGVLFGAPPGSFYLTRANDGRVENSYIEADDNGVVGNGRWVENVEIVNNTIVGADTGVFQDGSNDLHIAENTITGAERGIYGLEGAYYGTYEDNVIEADVGIDLEGTYFGGYHGQEITGNTFESDVGLRMNDFREFLAPGTVYVNYNDFEATDVAIESTRNPDDLATIDARLNWFGERGTGDATVVQTDDEIVYDPFLSEKPSEVDRDDPRAFATGLELERETAYAIGVPGPVAGNVTEIFGTEFEGAVYGFDADAQEWRMLDGNDSVGALDGLYVKPTENATATLSFYHGEDADNVSSQTTLQEGWNFVGAPQRTGVEAAYTDGTATPRVALGLFERPDSRLAVQQGTLDGAYVFGSNATEPTVSPFDGAFVYSESEGTVEGQLPANPTLEQLYDDLNVENRVDESILTGATAQQERQFSTTASDAEYQAMLVRTATAAVASRLDSQQDLGDAPVQKVGALARQTVYGVASHHDHDLSDRQLDAAVRKSVERVIGENVSEALADEEPVGTLADHGYDVGGDVATRTASADASAADADGSATSDASDAEYQVAFIDGMNPLWHASDRMVEELDARGDLNESYEVTPVHATEFFDDLNASLETYDIVVVNNLGTVRDDVSQAKIERFVEYAERPDLGVVYLGQKNDDPPNAIHEISDLRGDPAEAHGDSDWGADEVFYRVSEDHAVFDGVAGPGEKLHVLDDPWSARYGWFEGYDGETLADLGTDDEGAIGDGVGYDEVRNEVLLSSSAFNGFVIEWDFTDDAFGLLSNAIEQVDPAAPVMVKQEAPLHVEPGESVESRFLVAEMNRVKVELGANSTVSPDDVTVTVGNDTAELGEWRTFDEPVSDASYPIRVETDDDVAGKVVLDVTVESEYTDGPVELTVGPTAVYEPPLVAGDDVATVQEAVDLAPDDGRTVYVADGTYEESVTITTPDLTLKAADGAEPTVAATDGPAITVAADGVTVSGLDVAAGGNDGVVVAGVDDATVSGVDVRDATTGISVADSTDATVADVTVDDASTGVAVENAAAATVTDTTATGVDTGVSLVGSATEASITDVTVDGGTGVALSGVDREDVTVRFNDLSATDVGVDSDLNGTFDARLNYLGHGTADTAIEGDVAYEPFLTAPPEEVDHDEPTRIGIELFVDAGETTSIGVPGRTDLTAGELFSDDFEGTVYDFNSGQGRTWQPMDDDEELDTLEGLRVEAETDGHAVIEFRGAGPSAPGTVELEHGWNFVAAPMYADAETAFQVGSADVRMGRDNYKFKSPDGQPGPASDFNGSYVFGSGKEMPNVSAFQGHFVHVSGDGGTVPSYVYSDVTMEDLYPLIGLDEPDLSDDDSESEDSASEDDSDARNVASPSRVGPAATSPAAAATSG